jgi:hypothetical protein
MMSLNHNVSTLTVRLHLCSPQEVRSPHAASQRPGCQAIHQRSPLTPCSVGCHKAVLVVRVGGPVFSQVGLATQLTHEVEGVACAACPVKPAIVVHPRAAVTMTIAVSYSKLHNFFNDIHKIVPQAPLKPPIVVHPRAVVTATATVSYNKLHTFFNDLHKQLLLLTQWTHVETSRCRTPPCGSNRDRRSFLHQITHFLQ